MPFVLRKSKDESNPTLPDAYGIQQTAGRLVYWYFSGGRTHFLILFCRGGKYGCDGLNYFRYRGVSIPEFQPGQDGNEIYRNWRLHRGTVTKQIVVKNFTADESTDVLTVNAHGYTADIPIRLRSNGGVLPTGLVADAKYFVINPTTNSFQLSETVGGSVKNFTSNGSGQLKVWQANAGFDDLEQGRPQFFPELNLTFSNICYIEGILPATYSEDAEPTGFQFGLRCRRVADFDVNGNYLTNNFSANNARVYADILLNELKRPPTRNHWQSWFAFKQACDVMIWQRTAANGTIPGSGLIGRYYNHPNWGTGGNPPPPTFEAATLVLTRTDPTINFSWGNPTPAPEVNADWFLIRWEGKIKAQYSEVYTFKTIADNGVRVWINNQLIIDRWSNIVATDTGTIQLNANTLYNIKVEFYEAWGEQAIRFYWSSASQTEQIIPANRLYPSDLQIRRYESHVVFPSATQAGAALDLVMKRAPGWHVQDVNGKLKFLPPDRPVAHHFVYDPDAPNQRFNIAAKTFEANPRRSDERPNFRINYYNDLQAELLEEKWIESDRPALREKQGGLPTDSSPARWGVMSRSLVERCGEDEMRMFSDPDRDFTLRGMSDSYHISKGDRVLLSHTSTNDTFAAPVECIVVAESFGAGTADEKSYGLLPRTFPLITDEPI